MKILKSNIPAALAFTVIGLSVLANGMINTVEAEPLDEPPSIEVKVITPVVVEEDKTPLDEIFIEVCAEKGFHEPQCWKDLKAMAIKETTNLDPMKVGDQGQSYGLFQIHRGYHPDVSIEQARDPWFASRWTLNRLISKGYPEYRTNAIRAHNGSLNNPVTLQYAEKVKSIAETL